MKTGISELGSIIQEEEERRRREIADLSSRSKPLDELVTQERFTVEEVISQSYVTFFTPDSEKVIIGKSPVYRGGFTSKLVLKVLPDNPNIPVRILYFDGISRVDAGDYISAQIPRYEEKRVKNGFISSDQDPVFYIERELTTEESLIELTILSADGKVLRRERSVNYEDFIKK